MKVSIYVVTHKAFQCPKGELYRPIQVGKSRTKTNLGILSDDTGINIAEKNSEYCELTALYWIWKNDVDSDYIGLCHYRRYFSKNCSGLIKKSYIREDDVLEILTKNDVIVPKKNYWGKKTVAEMYDYGNSEMDLNIIRKIISEDFPDYVTAYDNVLNSHSAFYRNMMICKRDIFSEYCDWLFSVLFKFEEEIKKQNVSADRKMGFISEFLLDVWVLKNNMKTYQSGLINTEDTIYDSIKGGLKNTINRCGLLFSDAYEEII